MAASDDRNQRAVVLRLTPRGRPARMVAGQVCRASNRGVVIEFGQLREAQRDWLIGLAHAGWRREVAAGLSPR